MKEYKTPAEQREAAKQYYHDNKAACLERQRAYVLRNRTNPAYHVRNAVQQAKHRAKRAGLPFNLSPDNLLDRLAAIGYRCQMTGAEFTFEAEPRNPNSVVIDRRDPALGYTEDNVQLVTNIYNLAKHTWSDAAVLDMAQKLVTQQNKLY